MRRKNEDAPCKNKCDQSKKIRWLADLPLTFYLQRERERNKDKKKYKYLKRKITKKNRAFSPFLIMSLLAYASMYLFLSPVMLYCHPENKTIWINFMLLKKINAFIANSKALIVRFMGLMKCLLYTSSKQVSLANCRELLVKFLKEL